MEVPPPDVLKKPFIVPYKTLMAPGPSNPTERVLKAMSQPFLGPFHEETIQLLDEVKAGVKYLFQTQNEATMCVSGAGHAGMEMALCNLIEDDTVVLIGTTGIWGMRAADIAKRHGAKVFEVEALLGEALAFDQIKAAFDAYRPQIFFIAQGESSTGVLQTHMQEIGELCRLQDCLFIVDAVASAAGTEFYMDMWCIDVAFTGSQKVLGASACITPISFNERAIRHIQARKSKVRVYYLDAILIGQYWGCFDSPRSYHHTVSSVLLIGLREALAQVCEEGLEVSVKRHRECANRLEKGIERIGLKLFVQNPKNRLPTVVTFKLPGGINGGHIKEYAMKKYSFDLNTGFAITGNKILRIGIMGRNATHEKVDLALKILEEALNNIHVMGSSLMLKKCDIRVLLKYEFLKGNSAAETARNINSAIGIKIISERTVRFRFEKFRAGNFDLQNEPRGRPEIKVNNEELKAAIEADPTQTARELAFRFHVSKPTILVHLAQIGKIKKPRNKETI